MDLDTRRFIKMIDTKLKISLKEINEIIANYEEEKPSQSIQDILQNIDIMCKLIDIYLLLETESIPEMEQLHKRLISAQAYITLKQSRRIANI
ncbi:hypothetical protein [Bacillus wiedmannii]|uniref:hypothetical protein n=1 Tax=Bacillus wiedmannii TaxID=1890302 RepID=UPI001D0EC28C|nr:hypothetical protein [Bacillus wiedmannii]MCC2329072.1 hypothetical protein [Bacillus wiedmannii]